MQETMTNEKLAYRFKSQFDLVNYSINLVKNMVHSGRAPRVSIDIQNPAVVAVREIEQGRDLMVAIPQERNGEKAAAPVVVIEKEPPMKTTEKKKPRRLL